MAEKMFSSSESKVSSLDESVKSLYYKFKTFYLAALVDKDLRDRLFEEYGCINESLLRRFAFTKDGVTGENNQIREDQRDFKDLPEWNRRAITDAMKEFIVLNRNFHVLATSDGEYRHFQIQRLNNDGHEPTGDNKSINSDDENERNENRRQILFERKKQYYGKILYHPEIQDLLRIEGYIDQKIIRRYLSIRRVGDRILQDPREFSDLGEWDQRALVEAFREYANENQDKCRLSEIEGKPPIISLKEGEQFRTRRYTKPNDSVGEIKTRLEDD
jgi:hypothetical protein